MNREPRVMLATLCLNEMEWLPKLVDQHIDWPGMAGWVFVEAADFVYARVNPTRVTGSGLSVDGTTEFLRTTSPTDLRLVHVEHGFAKHADPAQGKIVARNRYLEIADGLRPDFIVVVDADEFYPHEMQRRINDFMTEDAHSLGWCFRHREIWNPPSCNDPTFAHEVVGGFWGIPYARCWRWSHGMRYVENHNTPNAYGKGLMDRALRRLDRDEGAPYFVHTAFASKLADRRAKHRYYEKRGERSDPKRRWYTESRSAWESWQEGDVLPKGARVKPYDGIIPECFQ